MDELYQELCLLCLLYRRRRKKANKIKKRFWVREILQKITDQREYHNLLQEMRLSGTESHFHYLRMSNTMFDQLLSRVGPILKRRMYHCPRRPEVSPGEMLALTLRYLATGNSQTSLTYNFRIAPSNVCSILQETCSAIWNALCTEYVKAPSTGDDWKVISNQFYQK